MKKLSIICTAFILLLQPATRGGDGPHFPSATGGVIDLSSWDFKKNGPVPLNGEWEFYWGDFISPENFHRLPRPVPTCFIKVPSDWSGKSKSCEKFPVQGYVTYRLTVRTPVVRETMSLKTGDISTAFDAYANGEKIASVGTIGTNADSSQSWLLPGTITLPQGNGTIELVFHVSNFHNLNAGINGTILIGPTQAITAVREKKTTFDLFLFGSIIIMGIYHISLFVIRRKDRSTLYFGIYCLCISFFTLMTGERFLFAYSPWPGWGSANRFLALSVYIAVPVFALFMREIFPKEFSIHAVRFFLALGVFFPFASLPFDVLTIHRMMLIYEFIIILACSYGSAVLILAIIRRRESARIFASGFILLFATVVNDVLHDSSTINTGYAIPFGLLVFIFSQAVILAFRFSRAFKSVEKLSGELSTLNQTLEEKVRGRTEELHAAMKQLVIMNETINEKNKKLERAQKIATIDMKMAADVQANYLPNTIPHSDEWDIAYYFRPYSGVSGDFYDFYTQDDILRGVGLFDVSGHGISSGLVTMIAKSTIFRKFTHHFNEKLNVSLEKANEELRDEIRHIEYYITGVLLKFEGNLVRFVNAGHPDMYVRTGSIVFPIRNKRGNSGKTALLGLHGLDTSYEEITFTTEKNDTIILYSDCLIENKNEAGEQYGLKRMIESLRNAPENSARMVLDYITGKFYQFIGNEEHVSDDLTIIIMKRL